MVQLFSSYTQYVIRHPVIQVMREHEEDAAAARQVQAAVATKEQRHFSKASVIIPAVCACTLASILLPYIVFSIVLATAEGCLVHREAQIV